MLSKSRIIIVLKMKSYVIPEEETLPILRVVEQKSYEKGGHFLLSPFFLRRIENIDKIYNGL